MKYYKDTENKLHALDNVEFLHLLPEGCIEITEEEFITISSPPLTLSDLKVAKNNEINLARATANTTSFTHDGKSFSCDSLSRSDIDGVNGYVALYGTLPPEFPGAWKTADNAYYPIASTDAWKQFYTSLVSAGTVNFNHSQQLKTQLEAATTAEEIAAIVW